MKIAFVINQTHKEEENCSTSLLAFTAVQRGHSILYIGVADFCHSSDGQIYAYARTAGPDMLVQNNRDLVAVLTQQQKQYTDLDEVDVVWLRFDPTVELSRRPWAPQMGLQFANRLKSMGKFVVNDPEGLAFYNNKLYLEDFPASVRPAAVITRNYNDVENFMQTYPNVILKPLQGSTGKNVFFVPHDHTHNLKQIVETLTQEGYFVVQEYLPAAREGDVRLYLLNGEPIEKDGRLACLKRIPPQNEVRSNIHQGGLGLAAEVTPEYLSIVAQIKEKLIADGMYFVGLDIVGNKLLEINVNSAGGLAKTNEVHGVDFTVAIMEDLENRVERFYGNLQPMSITSRNMV